MNKPKLWQSAQWMADQDTLDFHRVRPDAPVEQILTVMNAGGDGSLMNVTLRARQPWLEFKQLDPTWQTANSDHWQNSLDLRDMPARQPFGLILRANPARLEGRYGSRETEILVEANVQNGLDDNPLTVRATADFLPPIYLRLRPVETRLSEDAPVEDLVFAAETSPDSRHGMLTCSKAPIGSVVRATLRLWRDDHRPVTIKAGGIRIRNNIGKLQWIDWSTERQEGNLNLHLSFYTANRADNKTHEVELEITDSDATQRGESIQAARVTMRVQVASPPLLSQQTLTCRVLAGSGEQVHTVPLLNEGGGDLILQFVTAGEDCREWLTVQDVTSERIPSRTQFDLPLTINSSYLKFPGGRGVIEVECNHLGRPLKRRVLLEAKVIPYKVQMLPEGSGWNSQLHQGEHPDISVTVCNDDDFPFKFRLEAVQSSPEAGSWLHIANPRPFEVKAGKRANVHVQAHTKDLPASGQGTIAIGSIRLYVEDLAEPILEEQINLRILPRLRRGLFGLRKS